MLPSPTSARALRSIPSWYSVQFAGCVITMESGASPTCSVTESTTHLAISAVSLSAWYGAPDSTIGTGSPSRRLNSRASPCGWLAPRRSAAPAKSRSSPSAKMTEGTAF